jgi:TPR repeat protein
VANSMKSAQFLIESRLADAAKGDAQACYELGIAYSCGTGDVDIDLVERTNGSTSRRLREVWRGNRSAPRWPRR